MTTHQSSSSSPLRHLDPSRFVLAPFAPFAAIASTMGRAYQDMAASQVRLALTMGRTVTDVWLLAARRQQDALFGVSTPASLSAHVANDAGALNDAAAAAREASLELVRAQAQLLDDLKRTA